MDINKWFRNVNPNITYLIGLYLFNEDNHQENNGYIEKYLKLYNPDTRMWGDGLYGPKWISSTYTLLDLINLKASIDQRMVDAFEKLRTEIVTKYTLDPKDKRTLDLCIVGMLVRIGSYIRTDESNQTDLIDFILYTINKDGAWNCYFNYRTYQTSSLHTTINVLEGLAEYVKQGYRYRLEEVKNSMRNAEEFILKKKLFRSRRTNKVIHEQFVSIHFPTRWFYDMFRALEYFVEVGVSFDDRMTEALNIVREKLTKGPIPKGKSYAGKLHFKYDLDDYKRINTLRLLRIVKFYDREFYQRVVNR